ncbi:MAG: MBL fold metallo-hydrolase [Promethearchaeota archaeon]
MELKFLGTAAAEGFPALFCECPHCRDARQRGGRNLRCRSSLLVNGNLLIDYGPDTSAQSIRFNSPLARVENILLTHSHFDHATFGDMLFRSRGFHRRWDLAAATVWANPTTKAKFLADMVDLFAKEVGGGRPELRPTPEEVEDDLEGFLRLRLEEVRPHQHLQVGPYEVFTVRAHHSEPELAINYAIGDGSAWFLYATDTGPWAPAEWDYLESLELKFDGDAVPRPPLLPPEQPSARRARRVHGTTRR